MVVRSFTIKNNKMVMANLLSVIMLMHAIVGLPFHVRGLSMGYYMMSCPFAEQIVKDSVNNALQADPSLAAGLIRMLFHDCFIEVTFSLNYNYVVFYVEKPPKISFEKLKLFFLSY